MRTATWDWHLADQEIFLTYPEKDVKQKMENKLIPLFPEVETNEPKRNLDIFLDAECMTIPMILLNYMNHRQAVVFASLHLFLNSPLYEHEFDFFIHKRMKWVKMTMGRWADTLRISTNTLRSALNHLTLLGMVLIQEDEIDLMEHTRMYTVNYKHKKITYMDRGEFDYGD